MELSIKLEIFEGPLDLLLHLIKKNEVDIYDIPIALITSQYLEYLDLMKSFNIEVAGEFLVMAATLTKIKSRMLLPSLAPEEEEEEEDPRMAIVRPLLEHMKLKDLAEALERRAVLDRDVFVRTPSLSGLDLGEEEGELVEASLFDLMDAFRRLVSRLEPGPGLEITLEAKSLEERITEIIEALKEKGQTTFEELSSRDQSRGALILTFLAVLELARLGLLRLFQHPVSLVITIFYTQTSPLVPLEPAAPGAEPGPAEGEAPLGENPTE